MTNSWMLMLALVVSYAGSTILGPKLIPYLQKLKFGQSIREEGPKSHYKKAGTPTMGGFIFLAGLLLAMLLVRAFDQVGLFMLFAIFGFGMLGFADDYIKVVLKRNLGLRAWQNLLDSSLSAQFWLCGVPIFLEQKSSFHLSKHHWT